MFAALFIVLKIVSCEERARQAIEDVNNRPPSELSKQADEFLAEYGGTEQQAEPPPTDGFRDDMSAVGGFPLDATREQLERECEDAGHEWVIGASVMNVSPFDDIWACSGVVEPLPVMPVWKSRFDFTEEGRLESIFFMWEPNQDGARSQFDVLKTALQLRYGIGMTLEENQVGWTPNHGSWQLLLRVMGAEPETKVWLTVHWNEEL